MSGKDVEKKVEEKKDFFDIKDAEKEATVLEGNLKQQADNINRAVDQMKRGEGALIYLRQKIEKYKKEK